MTTNDINMQVAPFPKELADLVRNTTYRPGWRFYLIEELDRGQDSRGLTLDIVTHGYNSYHRPAQPLHEFGPGATCSDCSEPFPCSGYKRSEDEDAPRPPYHVHHYMPVPPAAYNRQSWQRWLFEQIVVVERHEACEFFTIDKVKPYAPNHGPGWDPYIVTEMTTELDRRTKFTGEVNPA